MVEIGIGTNEQGQRLDRFLRKYLPGAPLSLIYRMVRKDVKVNGKRKDNVYMLEDGDVVTLYFDPGHVDELRGTGSRGGAAAKKPRRTFRIAYEDEKVLITDKPAGLLTHGDRTEKSKHLTNQVLDYLIEKGEYDPRNEKTFSPSPVNRIDRNTSGLVIFAKDYETLKRFNEYIRERKKIRKFYLTVLLGEVREPLKLAGMISKDERRNVSGMTGAHDINRVAGENALQGKGAKSGADEQMKSREALTFVKPVMCGNIEGLGDQLFTLAEVEIETGRTHQIRVQLADAGHPLAGDPKYGDAAVNRKLKDELGLTHQLLTAARLEFGEMEEHPGLSGKTVEAVLPKVFQKVKRSLEHGRKAE